MNVKGPRSVGKAFQLSIVFPVAAKLAGIAGYWLRRGQEGREA